MNLYLLLNRDLMPWKSYENSSFKSENSPLSDIFVVFAISQFVRSVGSICDLNDLEFWWLSRRGWWNEGKYANGGRTDAATDNGTILTLFVAASVNKWYKYLTKWKHSHHENDQWEWYQMADLFAKKLLGSIFCIPCIYIHNFE